MQNIREKFEAEYLTSWWSKVRLWFLVRKVYRQKINTVWESNLDKLFYETQFNEELNYIDDEDRAKLKAENQKPLDQQDQLLIVDLETRISRAKAIKQSYEKNEQFRADTKAYIYMLDLWKQNKNQSSD